MKNSYKSLEEIRGDYKIAEEDPEKIRVILRRKQSSIHPDHSGGSFANKNDENLFHRLSSAIEFIDNRKENGALVSVSAVTDLTKAITELVKVQSSSLDNNLSEKIKHNIQSYRSKFKLPKIALSAITIGLTAVWLFPTTVKEHPILRRWFNPDDILFQGGWFLILIFTLSFWVMVWINEERQREFQESLKTEMVQNRLFIDFIEFYNKKMFSIEDLVKFITKEYGRRYKISISTAHTIAENIIKRALYREAIKKHSLGHISEAYSLIEHDG